MTLRNSACRLRRTSYLRQPMKKTNCKAPDFQTFPSSARSYLLDVPGFSGTHRGRGWRHFGDVPLASVDQATGNTARKNCSPEPPPPVRRGLHADVVRSELRRIAERGDGCRSGSRVELTWQAAGQLPDDRPAGLRSVLTSLRQTLPRRRSDRLCTVCIRPSTRAPTQ